ncbi:ATP-binding cassette domain-containing protein [Solidesulfovibrio magneticus]|uniref:Molybdenum ABC transporter ATP-binding protein n=1 Tax=Solidesulfovibrio magneticus (strain ATCC 700980 / DSM 13731 / RS-1) TaxID=573370 RepID=C4XR98_SOLM1|nr:ATP-binding cassette domain-containing protein [Solidesulfovibrio magneticus]BAH75443.1 putative molybdenum ABC transporter ATP-binding protein [Solidesulfovibrio magneticus RS-1]
MLHARVVKRLPHFTLEAEIRCPAGCVTVLTGPSGSGKSTLLRLLAGLDDPDEGVIGLGDTVWRDTAAGVRLPARRRDIGLVFQEYSLFPHMTLARNVAYAAVDAGYADELLALFGIIHLAGAKPAAMSGGERQRGAICQALARRPRALLLDEPFSALDAATRLALRAQLLKVRDRFGIPIVHVTHDLAEAAQLGDAIVSINQGRLDPDWFDRQLDVHLREQGALLARRGIDWAGSGPGPIGKEGGATTVGRGEERPARKPTLASTGGGSLPTPGRPRREDQAV